MQVRELRDPRGVYAKLMDLLSSLAGLGLIHCDFNEFNLLVGVRY
jgi:RIO kinase 2